MKNHPRIATLRLSPLARALAAASLLTLAHASAWPQSLPAGLNVVAGQAQLSTQGNQMTVANSPGAILNWSSFNIGAGHGVRFQQADASSQVLNRVLGSDPSQIFGQLSSNGRVWLLNPNGVLFGATARVDVASFVGSTLRLNDSDWLAGRFNFTGDAGSQASIVNRGEMRTSFGGRVALMATSVGNEGVIDAPGGQIVLGAGQSIDLVDTGAPHLAVRVHAATGTANNLGTLTAAGGRIDIHAAAVNQQGIVRADGFEQGPGGEVLIRATSGVQLGAASQTSADGASGGAVTIEAGGGRASVDGAVSALGRSGVGGSLHVLGREVGLFAGSRLDASGSGGGGEVLVGGGMQGRDARYINADAVFFDRDASITADAKVSGAGGTVILWSDKATRAFGSISARGGALGGDGGFIETSGGWLDARPAKIDVASPKGKAGTWLLDPMDIYIEDSASESVFSDITVGLERTFTSTVLDSTILTSTITGALNSGTNVTLTTGSGGLQAGNINLSGNINASPSAPVRLRLIADGDINVFPSSSITSGGAPLTIELLAARGLLGIIEISGATLNSAGGNITIAGLGNAFGPMAGGLGDLQPAVSNHISYPAIRVIDSTIAAGNGTISVKGLNTGGWDGIQVFNSTLTARDIFLSGTANTTSNNLLNWGVWLNWSSDVNATRVLQIDGLGMGKGVYINNGAQARVSSPSYNPAARLEINGRGIVQNLTEGVSLYQDEGAPPTVSATNAASLTFNGQSDTGYFGVLVNGAGQANVAVRASGVPIVDLESVTGVTRVQSAAIEQVGAMPSGTKQLVMRSESLFLTNGAISSNTAINLLSNVHWYEGTSQMGGTAAVRVTDKNGSGGTPSFRNYVGSTLFAGGPWTVWALDSADTNNFIPGGLAYDYKRYGVVCCSNFGDAGNGFQFTNSYALAMQGTVASRPYNGSTAAAGTGIGASGAVGDTATLRTGVGLVFNNKNVGVNKTVSFSEANPFNVFDSLGKPIYGYTVPTTPYIATISALALSYSGVTANNKVYDATTAATLTLAGNPLAGVISGDTVSLSGSLSASFADKNVGAAKAVTVGGLSLLGADASNYTLVPLTGLTANITARPLTLGGVSVANKVYDGSTLATLSGSPLATPLANDQVVLSGTAAASFADKNVGTNKPVQLTGLTLSGADATNYSLQAVTGLAANISSRPISVTGLVANNKVYDATTVATLGGTPMLNAVSGDLVFVSSGATGSFSDKNVGTAKAVSVAGLTLSGADAANYTLAPVSGLFANITPRALSVSGLTADDKVYNGNALATFSGSAAFVAQGGDVLTLVGSPSGSFADKNVGTAKPVTVSGLALGGADAGNYSVQPLLGLTATITLRDLAVSGLGASSKVYDANTTAALTGSALIAPLSGDGASLTGSASGNFVDKNVGSNKVVNVSGLALGGSDAANYRLLLPTNLRADISARSLGVSGVTVANKVYDATTQAFFNGAASITALAGDAVSLSSALAGNFADKHVGNGKAVTVSGLSLTGADAGNYTLAPLTGLSANITPRSLQVGGVSAIDKVYNGNLVAPLAGSASIAPLAGDTVQLAGSAAGSFANKNVGAAKAVTVSGLILQGADANNYSLVPPAGLTANITAANLAVTGLVANARVYDGTTTAPLAGSAGVTPLPNDLVTLTGTASGSFANRNVGNAKLVTLAGLSLTGADAGNYLMILPTLRADVTQATLSYVADPALRLIGEPIGVLSGVVTGLIGGDTLAAAASGTLAFTTAATTASPAGVYAVQGGGLSATNYRLQQAPTNATALAIVGLGPQTTAESGVNQVTGAAAQVQTQSLPVPNANAGQAGMVDLASPTPTPAPASVSSGAAGASASAGAGVTPTEAAASFGGVQLASLSVEGLQELLDARDRYKKNLFAESIVKLEQNPALADLRPCTSLKEAELGTCLVTETMLSELRAQQAKVAAAKPTPASPATPGAAPAAPGAMPAPPVATPPSSPATAAATPAAAAPLPERRRVLNAALPQIERKVALVIGVDRYADTSIPSLNNAVRDAQAVGQLFDNDLGYETQVLENAKRSDVVAALNRLALELRPQDSVVIYYAGHGELVESTKLGYWQLSDAKATDPQTWLSNADISRLVSRIGAAQVALISDSCYSGSLVSEERLRASAAPLDPVAVLTRKSVVIMSSGGNEPVFDDGKNGHSPFAFNLMNTLRQVGTWKPGGQVFERVRFAVARELPQRPQYGVSAAAGHQTGGDYLFEQRALETRR